MDGIVLAAKLIHIVCGTVALGAGPTAMFTRKGGWRHRQSGFVYLGAVLGAVGSGLVMLLVRPSLFSLGVAILSFVTTLSGYRSIQRARSATSRTTWGDWSVVLSGVIGGSALLAWSTGVVPSAMDVTGRGVGGFIGLLTLWTVAQDGWLYLDPPTSSFGWIEVHLGRMLGSYLSVVTGFLVQAGTPFLVQVGLPSTWGWMLWVVPSLIGVPGWLVWRRRLRRGATTWQLLRPAP